MLRFAVRFKRNPQLGLLSVMLLTVVPLSSCNSDNSPTAQPSPIEENDTVAIYTTTPAITHAASTNVFEATEEPELRPNNEPTLTPESTEDIEVIPVCPGNGSITSPPDDFGLPGSIIYQEFYHQGLYMIGGQPLQKSTIIGRDNQQYDVYGLSSDGNWLAFSPVSERNVSHGVRTENTKLILETPSIVLLSASGERLEQRFDFSSLEYLDRNGKWWREPDISGMAIDPYSYWVNDNLLYMTIIFDNPTDRYSRGFAVPILFDPFINSWLSEPFSNLNRFNNYNLSFSPDLSRVVYEKRSGDTYSGLEMKDFYTDQVLWSERAFPLDGIIRWSPDSSKFIVGRNAFGVDDQLLLVNSLGEVKSIASDFQFENGYGFNIADMEWSHDSRYLSFVTHRYYPDEQVDLYIISEEKFTITCPLTKYKESISKIFWSPDSQYLAISGLDEGLPLQIIDKETGKVYELTQNAYAVGWSNQFSEAVNKP